jgi:hypothetical protein
MPTLSLWQRVLGCCIFVAVGVICVISPDSLASTRHSSGEVELVGWLVIAVFSFAAILQLFRGLHGGRKTDGSS